MARKILPCAKCNNKFSTRMLKVYVFKRRHCPKKGCKAEMFTYNDEKLHVCPKCGTVVKFDDQMTLGSMGVVMKGTSRSGKVAETMKREGYEVTKVLIPEKRYCQRCLNISKMINNMYRKEAMKRRHEFRDIPKEEAAKIIRNTVLQQLREQHQQEVEKRKQGMKGKEKSCQPKKFKGAIVSKKSKEMCITPFNTVPFKKKVKKESKKNS